MSAEESVGREITDRPWHATELDDVLLHATALGVEQWITVFLIGLPLLVVGEAVKAVMRARAPGPSTLDDGGGRDQSGSQHFTGRELVDSE